MISVSREETARPLSRWRREIRFLPQRPQHRGEDADAASRRRRQERVVRSRLQQTLRRWTQPIKRALQIRRSYDEKNVSQELIMWSSVCHRLETATDDSSLDRTN